MRKTTLVDNAGYARRLHNAVGIDGQTVQACAADGRSPQRGRRAALRNNALGTDHAALAAAEVGAERFALISTDKAVNPTNVMGATKRVAEKVISAMAADHPATLFMAVRFGNVLGSSGSVIPKFKEQIARGGPGTVIPSAQPATLWIWRVLTCNASREHPA